jgi:hypothetical protein
MVYVIGQCNAVILLYFLGGGSREWRNIEVKTPNNNRGMTYQNDGKHLSNTM